MPPQGGGAQPPYFWGPLPTSASASMRTRPFTLSCFPEGKVHWLVARAGGGTGDMGLRSAETSREGPSTHTRGALSAGTARPAFHQQLRKGSEHDCP